MNFKELQVGFNKSSLINFKWPHIADSNYYVESWNSIKGLIAARSWKNWHYASWFSWMVQIADYFKEVRDFRNWPALIDFEDYLCFASADNLFSFGCRYFSLVLILVSYSLDHDRIKCCLLLISVFAKV